MSASSSEEELKELAKLSIKHNLVDENEKKLLLENYKFECRSCGNINL